MENQTTTGVVVVWAIVGLLVGGFLGYYIGKNPMYGTTNLSSQTYSQDKAVELQQNMRKLWEDHTTWTRLYIVEAVGGLPGVNDTGTRLLKNQEDTNQKRHLQ